MLAMALLALAAGAAAVDHEYCEDLQPQMDVNIAMLTGVWFGVEYIHHERPHYYSSYDNYRSRSYSNRLDYLAECFFIDIKELDPEPSESSSYYGYTSTPYYGYKPTSSVYGGQYGHHQDLNHYRHLVLQWDEPGNLLDYHVKFNASRRGFWMSTAPRNGARVEDMYKYFAGTIQVLKVFSNHLVLSFCQRLPENQLFTVIFSRQKGQFLDGGEIIAIHSMLTKKGLSTSSVKKVCYNSAAVLNVGLSSALLGLMAWLISRGD